MSSGCVSSNEYPLGSNVYYNECTVVSIEFPPVNFNLLILSDTLFVPIAQAMSVCLCVCCVSNIFVIVFVHWYCQYKYLIFYCTRISFHSNLSRFIYIIISICIARNIPFRMNQARVSNINICISFYLWRTRQNHAIKFIFVFFHKQTWIERWKEQRHAFIHNSHARTNMLFALQALHII